MERTVVISVPHAACQPVTLSAPHPCDSVAPQMAKLLATRLNAQTVIFGSVPRSVVDMNRYPSRLVLDERKRLKEATSNQSKVILVDVHSYDDSAPWGEGADLVVFDTEPLQYVSVLTMMHIRHMSNVRVGFVVGSQQNDIIIEAKSRGVPSIMLEVHEGSNLVEIADAVAAAINYVFERRLHHPYGKTAHEKKLGVI